MMRIAMDGVPLLTPKTGIGTYTQELFDALRHMPHAPKVHLIYGVHWFLRLRKKFASKGNHAPPASHATAYQQIRWLPEALKQMVKQATVWGELTLRNPQLYHATNYTAPDMDCPLVTTVHDLSFLRYPQTHPTARNEWLHQYLPSTLARSARIITVSDFTRRELIQLTAVEPDKIRVVHEGVSPRFRQMAVEQTAPVLEKYALEPGRYILSVGTIEPRKNLSLLIQAYEMLPASVRRKWPLAVVGLRGWKADSLGKQLDRLARKGDLRLPGYVPDQDLPSLYAGAGLFVYPSLYEGFGLPPLAMASGVATIVSERASLPEVVGPAGILVPPHDSRKLRDSMLLLIEDPEQRRRLGHKGLQRAARFSWPNCAHQTMNVYREAMGKAAMIDLNPL